MPPTITFKPEVITARPHHKAKHKPHHAPQQPKPGVVDMDPITIEGTPGGKGATKSKCNEKLLGKDLCESLDKAGKQIDDFVKNSPTPKFNSAALQRGMNLNSNSSSNEVFSAIGNQTW